MGKTRKAISVLHWTQNIQKEEKNSLCCIYTKPYMNLKFKKMYFFRETTRKTIYALHLTQTILRAEKNSLICIKAKAYRNLKFRKKGSFMEKTREKFFYYICLKTHKNKKRTLCAAFDPNNT